MLATIDEETKLRVTRQIAQGGMGSVCEAIQFGADGFEKKVAIKELLPALCQDAQFTGMFIDEAKLVANLVHENIVQIYQLSCVEGQYHIIMEYVHGLSLAQFMNVHVTAQKMLSEEMAVFIASRIARGLAYAHSRLDAAGQPMHIVHRDVCPNNILITTEGLPKLGDFGIAKAATHATAAIEGRSIGKAFYMSPEQAWGKPVDFRSDIYSLGIVLFELLSMKRAREKWTANAIFAASKGWVQWDLLPETVSVNLRKILKCMLDPDPEKRYAKTDILAHDLEYHIYHKGYGPTVVVLEQYLRHICPELYQVSAAT
ncbi:MAG: hypothetical protein A3K19_30670 [Lentisphaerae bacterium RIFOXYB12_FULL_65_16]|nr:MAG: hypothetical protein A3K18_01100 [Lentisphaerae bacterium RIFOXYA12_64_32]OGV88782.1 MAG: hypothetical protein A3K19_30670 [Lentisphaerae bacterium RIFOXYB12_FULL_65_16]